MPARAARCCTSASQAPASRESSWAGNFAIHELPLVSVKLAFGRAPPKEAPGATSTFSH